MGTPEDHIAMAWRAQVRASDGSLSSAQSLTHFKDVHAWVLIADPGSGKSDAFQALARAEGGYYITARNFFDLALPANWTAPLLIDGLDEITGGGPEGSTPLGNIRTKLQALGTPRFRLSCREADWRGSTDGDALRYLVGEDKFLELHLAPLDSSQIEALVMHWQQSDAVNARTFIQEAEDRDLEGLLDNPQTLRMLVKAVGNSGNDWPSSKSQAYAMACAQLVREPNAEHLAKHRQHALPDSKVLEAAGYLCAILLLSGKSAIALQRRNEHAADALALLELQSPTSAPDQASCQAALHTRLFRSSGGGDFGAVHRTVAEYLGAQYLAKRIAAGLPIKRVWALLLGQDAGVVPELRGLHAWLAATVVGNTRTELIDHDPLGVVLHGDVHDFSRQDKLHVLRALHLEATRYAYFRSRSWTSKPFGALASADMQDEFKALLQSPDRTAAHQALLDCVLDAMTHGHPMPELVPDLERVVRDRSYWSGIRGSALTVWIHLARETNLWATLLQLLTDVHGNVVEDLEDELLGNLLQALYPGHIEPAGLWKYFRRPKAENLIGTYRIFWQDLPQKLASAQHVPALLDALVSSGYRLENTTGHFRSAEMVGELLVRGVTQCGMHLETSRLFDWLSLGLTSRYYCPLGPKHVTALREWLSAHPAIYMALLEYGIVVLAKTGGANNLWGVGKHLYDAQKPEKFGAWLLSLAERYPHCDLRTQLLYSSYLSTQKESGIDASIQLLEAWSTRHAEDADWVSTLLQSPYPPTQAEEENTAFERSLQEQSEKESREKFDYFRATLPSFLQGTAHLGALAEVAEAYLNFFEQSHQPTPHARLMELLNQDSQWTDQAIAGLRQCLFRDDLPSMAEIVDLYGKGRRYTLAVPCLASMDLRYTESPQSAFKLPQSTLETAITFRLINQFGAEPAWFTELISKKPLVFNAPMEYLIGKQIAAKKENVDGLFALANDANYAEVARRIVPSLIHALPSKAAKTQLSSVRLLIGALLKRLDPSLQRSIVEEKLNAKAMDVAQHIYWLTTGMLVAPQLYLGTTRQFIRNAQPRANHLYSLIYELQERGDSMPPLDTATQVFLVELLGPRSTPRWPGRRGGAYRVTPQMEMGRFIETLISSLAGNPDDLALQALTDLHSRHDLAQWDDSLNRALYDQQITRRKAQFKPADVAQICNTLANTAPANAADLWALTVDHLTRLSNEIRNGNTNDYRQYWAGAQPKKEDDCRDALLSDLKRLLAPLHISAEPEGRYADERRTDIKVSLSPYQIPIEIKRETHVDLWKAIPNQLIAKYSREMSSDGYGIFLVFWFNGQFKAAPTDGGSRPTTPLELQRRLGSTVPEHLRNKIAILVVDCSKPSSSADATSHTG